MRKELKQELEKNHKEAKEIIKAYEEALETNRLTAKELQDKIRQKDFVITLFGPNREEWEGIVMKSGYYTEIKKLGALRQQHLNALRQKMVK